MPLYGLVKIFDLPTDNIKSEEKVNAGGYHLNLPKISSYGDILYNILATLSLKSRKYSKW